MFQQVILMGNVGGDPEIKSSQSGQSIAKFSLATTFSHYNQENQLIKQTSWHRIVVFGNKAKNVVEKFVKKGSLLMITGRLSYSEYEKDGRKQYMTQIVANEIKLLPSKNSKSEFDGQNQPDEKPKQNSQSGKQQSEMPDNSWGNDMPDDMMQDNSAPTDDIPF